MQTLWFARAMALCLSLSAPVVGAGTDVPLSSPDIRIVFSGTTTPYTNFRHGLESALPEDILARSRFYADTHSLDPESMNDNTVIVSVGTSATRWALENTEQAIMASMIPAESFRRLRAAHPDRPLSALFIDQPPERHLALIRSILPEAQALAIFSVDIDRQLRDQLNKAAGETGLALQFHQVSTRAEIIRSIRNLGNRVDGLLILPSGQTMPPANLRALLLHSFRESIPVFGYSPGLVSAGSVAAVHTAAHELGAESAAHLQRLLKLEPGKWPPGTHPSGFRISTNRELARSLRLSLPSDEALRLHIRNREADNAP